MQHLILDLETLGKRAGCRVLSVALVRVSDEAHVQVNLDLVAQDMNANMLPDDADTVQWWRDQDPAAWAQCTASPYEMRPALHYLSNWIKSAGGAEFCIWGYGAGFDLPVLKHLYATFKVELPWQHWQEMYARTVRQLSGVDPEQFRVLPKHNPTNDAINDAITQARWFKAGMATLYGRMTNAQ